MSKSIYAILGIGIAACVLLSLVMKNLVEFKQQRAAPQLQLLLEEKFASQLTGPIRLEEIRVDGTPRLVANTCVTARLPKDRFAQNIGSTMWQQVQSTGMKAKEIEVRVSDERGGAPMSFMIPCPMPR
ncbi:MAG TPA: hypothetical protein VF384_16735 [Planctomycetota bacterium]